MFQEETLVKDGLDWGTIAVYMCATSCGDGGVPVMVKDGDNNNTDAMDLGAYQEEVSWVWLQLD